MGVDVRRCYHCGWLERDEWTKYEGPAQLGNTPYDGVQHGCPGYIVRQPLVIEASKAHGAYDKGVLDTYYPDIDNALAEAVQVISGAFAGWQAHRIKQQHERNRHNG